MGDGGGAAPTSGPRPPRGTRCAPGPRSLGAIACPLSPLHLFTFSPLNQLEEAVEQMLVVLRAGVRLRVVLDREDRQLAVRQALDRAVVQVDLADEEAGGRVDRRAVDLELVVLRGDVDAPAQKILDRVVGAVMAVLQ